MKMNRMLSALILIGIVILAIPFVMLLEAMEESFYGKTFLYWLSGQHLGDTGWVLLFWSSLIIGIIILRICAYLLYQGSESPRARARIEI